MSTPDTQSSSGGAPPDPENRPRGEFPPGAPDAASTPASAPPAGERALRTMPKDQPETWTPVEQAVVAALQTVFDPEIPVNIWELGLIYKIETGEDGHVHVDMTLTSPMCPVAGSLPPEVQQKVAAAPGVMAADVDVTWEPPWEPAMMSEAAKLTLNVPY